MRSCDRAYAVSAAAGMLRIGSSIATKRSNQLQAVHAGHADVGDQHVGHLLTNRIQRFESRGRGRDQRADTLEDRAQQLQRIRFIVDRQHADAVQARNVSRAGALPIGPRLLARGRRAGRGARSSAAASARTSRLCRRLRSSQTAFRRAARSTALRSRARGRGRPARAKTSRRACRNRSKTNGRKSGAMPRPVSLTVSST